MQRGFVPINSENTCRTFENKVLLKSATMLAPLEVINCPSPPRSEGQVDSMARQGGEKPWVSRSQSLDDAFIEQWNEEESECCHSTRPAPAKRQHSEPCLSSRIAEWGHPLPSVQERNRSGESLSVEGAPPSFTFNLDSLLRCPSILSDLETVRTEAPSDATSTERFTPCPSSSDRPRPMRLASHATSMTTVLFIDIQGFSTQCAILSVAEVGIWIAEFYARVGEMSARHGVCTVEVRGDCCVCVCGVLPAALQEPRQEETTDQVTRMLGFASDVDEALSFLNSPCTTRTRMGIATGEVSFLLSDMERGSEPSFACVHGRTVQLAEQMQTLSQPGRPLVHESSLKQWCKETSRPCPPTEFHFCKGVGPQQAAAYDLSRSSFHVEPVRKRKLSCY